MTSPLAAVREAVTDDAPTLTALVRAAYRGQVGWTTERAFLDDERIDAAGVTSKITNPRGTVLVATDDGGTVVGCCELDHRSEGLAYFGMFAVDPSLQAAGLGRALLARAEEYAAATWRARTMEMTVIAQRQELIDWYVRRGYTVAEETRPFPYDHLVNGTALRDDLYFVVLTKAI